MPQIRMTTDPKSFASKAALRLGFHLTDGTVHSFKEIEHAAIRALWEGSEEET